MAWRRRDAATHRATPNITDRAKATTVRAVAIRSPNGLEITGASWDHSHLPASRPAPQSAASGSSWVQCDETLVPASGCSPPACPLPWQFSSCGRSLPGGCWMTYLTPETIVPTLSRAKPSRMILIACPNSATGIKAVQALVASMTASHPRVGTPGTVISRWTDALLTRRMACVVIHTFQ
ncbi:hypothetical protein STPH2_4172 [Streptomyces sp. KO7888]|nr:hypothetical protein [Streptomyces sp. KO7888]